MNQTSYEKNLIIPQGSARKMDDSFKYCLPSAKFATVKNLLS